MTLYVKYIGEEFPSRSSEENKSLRKKTFERAFYREIQPPSNIDGRYVQWDNTWSSPWERHGWGRGSSNNFRATKDALQRVSLMMLRGEPFGCLIYDPPSGGVFKGNQRTYELITSIRYRHDVSEVGLGELVDAFRKSGLELTR